MSELNIIKEREHKVVMANTVINDMEYNLSKHYLLLLRYMISQIKPDDKPDKVYTIKIKDFLTVCGIDETNGGNYTRIIKKAYQDIQSKVKWIKTDNGVYAVQWFADFGIRQRTIEYVFHRRIAPYLFDLVHYKEGYTQYMFEDAIVMDSKYGIRLYEFIKEHHNMGRHYVSIELEKLKSILNGANYKLYNDFNRFILKKAVNEINKYTNIEVSYKGEKAKGSRAITSILFIINDVKNTDEYSARIAARKDALNEEQFPF